MKWPCRSFNQCIRLLPDFVQLALAGAFIAGMAVLVLTTGKGIVASDFLIVPVVMVGWYAKLRWLGYLVAAVAATVSALIPLFDEIGAPPPMAIALGAARFVLYVVLLSLLGVMRRERAGHQRAADTDRLTAAANARAFRERVRTEIDRAARYGYPLSLAYVDIDDFKAVNDRFGHTQGDRALVSASHVMRTSVRVADTVGRLGGDEFAILLPHTDGVSARTLVERLRDQLNRIVTPDGRPLSCSIGVVTFERPPGSVTEVIDAGDEIMYRAKQSGKGHVEHVDHGSDVRRQDGAPRSGRSPGATAAT